MHDHKFEFISQHVHYLAKVNFSLKFKSAWRNISAGKQMALF